MQSDVTLIRKTESRIMEDHLRIRALLDGLNVIGDPYVLIPLLRELKETLEEHFAVEEGDEGFFPLVEQHAPNRVAQVERLLQQHQELLASIDALIRKCRSALSGPLAEIRAEMNTLYHRIQNHDAAESEVLTEILIKSIPGEDLDYM